MMQAHTFRKLAPLRKWPRPDRLAHQLEQWRKAEQEQQDRQLRSELREFTEWTGLGI